MALIQLKLFGEFSVLDAQGNPLELRAKKARALLLYLALHPQQRFHREELAALLWPESTPTQALHSLRQTLSELRRQINGLEAYLNPGTPGIQLPENVIALDINQFINGLSSADINVLQTSIEHCRGDFLNGVYLNQTRFDDWLDKLKTLLNTRICNAMEEVAVHLQLDGKHQEAITQYQNVLAHDPLRESTVRALMDIYHRLGNTAVALELYESLLAQLHTLQRQPTAQTQQLYRRLHPEHQHHDFDVQTRTPTDPLPELCDERVTDEGLLEQHRYPHTFGRAHEIKIIEQGFFSLLHHQHGQVIQLTGEEGIGKTHLLKIAQEIARKRNLTCAYLSLRTEPYQENSSLSDLLFFLLGDAVSSSFQHTTESQLFCQQTGLTEFDFVTLKVLCNLPLAESYTGIADLTDSSMRTQRALHLLEKLLQQNLGAAPVCIILDDINVLDDVTTQLIQSLISITQHHPLLLLFAHPSNTTDYFVTHPHITSLNLAPLDVHACADFAKQYPDREPSFNLQCIANSGGSPLRLQWLLTLPNTFYQPFPNELVETINLHIQTLSTKDRAALEIACLLFETISVSLLQSLLDDVEYCITPLINSRFIIATTKGYDFTHASIPKALLALTPLTRQHSLHQRLAEHYRQTNPMVYALHLHACNDPASATALLYATTSVQQHPHLALQLLQFAMDSGITNAERFEIALRKADLFIESGMYLDALQSCELAYKLAILPEHNAFALLGMGKVMFLRGQLAPALNLLERATPMLDGTQFPLAICQLHYYRGQIFQHEFQIDKALIEFKLALHFAEQSGSLHWCLHAYAAIATHYYRSTRFSLARTVIQKGLALKHDRYSFRDIMSLRLMMARIQITQLQLNVALRDLADAERITILADHSPFHIEILLIQSNIHLLLGQRDQLLDKTQFAYALSHTNNNRPAMAFSLAYAALSDFYAGCLPEQDDRIDRAFMLVNDSQHRSQSAIILAMLACMTQDESRQRWALQEGERILAKGSVTMDKFLFYFYAIESALRTQHWELALHFADSFCINSSNESAALFTHMTKRARTLCGLAQGDITATLQLELIELAEEARMLGLRVLLPAYEMATRHLTTLLE